MIDPVYDAVKMQSDLNIAKEALRRLVLIGDCVTPLSIEHCVEQRQRLLAEVKNAKVVLEQIEGE